MAGLTTHILDLTLGLPANNVKIELYQIVANNRKELLKSAVTNNDGRLDSSLLTKEELHQAQYELIFYIGSYFREKGMDIEEPHFLEQIPVRFVVNNKEDYHVPLLVSPWGYQIYRGS